jgi:hypothetical protein
MPILQSYRVPFQSSILAKKKCLMVLLEPMQNACGLGGSQIMFFLMATVGPCLADPPVPAIQERLGKLVARLGKPVASIDMQGCICGPQALYVLYVMS